MKKSSEKPTRFLMETIDDVVFSKNGYDYGERNVPRCHYKQITNDIITALWEAYENNYVSHSEYNILQYAIKNIVLIARLAHPNDLQLFRQSIINQVKNKLKFSN